MVPTGDRPLWLVSLQITAAGSGGCSLPELINRVRALLPATTLHTEFDGLLQGRVARPVRGHLPASLAATNPLLGFAVTEAFPRLTPDASGESPVSDGTRVTDVRYRLDLTGRSAATCRRQS